ncbi:hypothetical protein [Filimonas effusa]|uniref:Uncharacterized protein n=1 Tax=Filimonas effusa TaxID=2508721 RepID=A0A4Q1DE97_9BACT|nr:hypothetical protein [Filimonas effusa]RXK86919.1 hypothetical protein ESB13_09065 [Filimonas effusa]
MMKKIVVAVLLVMITVTVALAGDPPFEGTLTTKVLIGGVDLSVITENIDYSKGDIKQQITDAYKKLSKEDLERLKKLTEANPMMGMAIMMTPPKGTITIKGDVTVARTRGLGYEIAHYHNRGKDDAYIYTGSLTDTSNNATATYKPSAGYAALFAGDKLVNADEYIIEKLPGTVSVAGYTCTKSVYTPKNPGANKQAAVPGMPAMTLQKLVVYSSAALPADINFSHPYYLPEKNGVMRIDIYFDKNDTPAMVYEVVDVKKASVNDTALAVRKTEPLYDLAGGNVMEYGMKLMGIMMGGLSMQGEGNENE